MEDVRRRGYGCKASSRHVELVCDIFLEGVQLVYVARPAYEEVVAPYEKCSVKLLVFYLEMDEHQAWDIF